MRTLLSTAIPMVRTAIIKIRGGFPNEGAAMKLLFLALRLAAKKWTMPIHRWREALNHFTILWPDRMPALERVTQ
jgi:putative transposase